MSEYAGWKIVSDYDDGSLLIENQSGNRRHIWQAGERIEQVEAERDALAAENQRIVAAASKLVRHAVPCGQYSMAVLIDDLDALKSALAAQEYSDE